ITLRKVNPGITPHSVCSRELVVSAKQPVADVQDQFLFRQRQFGPNEKVPLPYGGHPHSGRRKRVTAGIPFDRPNRINPHADREWSAPPRVDRLGTRVSWLGPLIVWRSLGGRKWLVVVPACGAGQQERRIVSEGLSRGWLVIDRPGMAKTQLKFLISS